MGEGTPYNDSNPTENQRRLTVHEAARRLGISEDAVRMRVKRGTLAADREGGRLYVLLDTEPTSEPTDRTSELIAELRDRVHSLEEQLDQANERDRENRRIIAALTSRIPELEAPRDERESSVSADAGAGSGGVSADRERGPERPWWRRLLGG